MNKWFFLFVLILANLFIIGCSRNHVVETSYNYPNWDSEGKIICVKLICECDEPNSYGLFFGWESINYKTEEYIVKLSTNMANEQELFLIHSYDEPNPGKLEYTRYISLIDNTIAYESRDTGIYSITLDNTDNNTILISTTAYAPSLSPDKSTIAYIDSANNNIRVIDIDGSNDRKIWDGGDTSEPVCWSSESSEIAFSTDDGIIMLNISTLGTNTLSMQMLSQSSIGDVGWSPDGNKLCYSTGHGTYIVNTDGSNNNLISDRILYNPKWSNNGNFITGGRGTVISSVGNPL